MSDGVVAILLNISFPVMTLSNNNVFRLLQLQILIPNVTFPCSYALFANKMNKFCACRVFVSVTFTFRVAD